MIAFSHAGQQCWAACSKNSADSRFPFVADAARLFGKYMSQKLMRAMLAGRVHICAEMMSKADQAHGAAVGDETPIVTSVGVGTALTLMGSAEPVVDTKDPNKFVQFMGFAETIAFCRENGLPVGSAVVATGNAARTFLYVPCICGPTCACAP